ncbi:S-layer homology domain-containing protein, partial [Cohnella sp. REN36]|nr:S-layer homology domain-containing protein [Cohnella sp. REN36]
ILQRKDGKWIPVGGKINSKSRTVEASIDQFGEYAAAVMYKTYKLDMVNNWSKPYVLALAYKGVIQPDMYLYDGRLLKDLNAKITRFDFMMMLARAKGLKPVQYNGH